MYCVHTSSIVYTRAHRHERKWRRRIEWKAENTIKQLYLTENGRVQEWSTEQERKKVKMGKEAILK